jgi:hypothetical protein
MASNFTLEELNAKFQEVLRALDAIHKKLSEMGAEPVPEPEPGPGPGPGPEPEPEPVPPVEPEVHATELGVDGNKIFKIKSIKADHTAEGSDPNNAIDRRKSTAYKGNGPLIAELEGVGLVRTVGLKINEQTSFKFKTSLDGVKFDEVVLGSLTENVHTIDQFNYFIFPGEIAAKFVSVDDVDDAKPLDITTMQILEIDPDPTGAPSPESPPPGPVDPTGLPIPTGFKTKGEALIQKFVHWGRHETNYASGGSGPSERWDNKSLPKTLNVLAGYEVNLGEKKGKRGEDNFDMKFRGANHSDSNCGWYIPSIEWGGTGKIGKECPHPDTEHLDIQEVEKDNVGNMKGDFWVGYMACCFNDTKGVPTMMLWAKPKGKDNSNTFADYIYMGKSKDTGNMKPGKPLTKIGMKGSTDQSLQIRMDEVPDAKIRNAWAIEIEPPE